jgi:hypothetical protein
MPATKAFLFLHHHPLKMLLLILAARRRRMRHLPPELWVADPRRVSLSFLKTLITCRRNLRFPISLWINK